ncbi:hypothetical protein ACFL9T_03090 [Thermodesulfobacteriota bacterium]
MEEQDIHRLFKSLLIDHSHQTDETRQVFSVLIKTTLNYRDHLLQSEGIVVTVEDVRSALDWLIPSLTTGRLPITDNRISLSLLKLWLDELKTLGKPQIYLA